MIFLLLSLLSSFAHAMECEDINESLDKLNKQELLVEHEPVSTTKIPGYQENSGKKLSYYLKMLQDSQNKQIYHYLIKEIMTQKEIEEISKFKRYYSQKYVKKNCDENHKDLDANGLSYYKSCTFLSETGLVEDELVKNISKMLTRLSLKNKNISDEEFSSICSRNKNLSLSQHCSQLGLNSKCPKGMTFEVGACRKKCFRSETRSTDNPDQCVFNQARYEKKIANKERWGKIGRTAAIVAAAGGVATVAAWGLHKLFKKRPSTYEPTVYSSQEKTYFDYNTQRKVNGINDYSNFYSNYLQSGFYGSYNHFNYPSSYFPSAYFQNSYSGPYQYNNFSSYGYPFYPNY